MQVSFVNRHVSFVKKRVYFVNTHTFFVNMHTLFMKKHAFLNETHALFTEKEQINSALFKFILPKMMKITVLQGVCLPERWRKRLQK